MKGPTQLWEPASHSGTPSHRNVSKSQFDPVCSVCSHSPVPPPAPWAAICRSPPEVCGLPVAPEAGTSLQHFPWIHFQQTEASPPHLTGLRGAGGEWWASGKSPHSSPFKEVGFRLGRVMGFAPQFHSLGSSGCKPLPGGTLLLPWPLAARTQGRLALLESKEGKEGLAGSHPGCFPLGRYAAGCLPLQISRTMLPSRGTLFWANTSKTSALDTGRAQGYRERQRHRATVETSGTFPVLTSPGLRMCSHHSYLRPGPGEGGLPEGSWLHKEMGCPSRF